MQQDAHTSRTKERFRHGIKNRSRGIVVDLFCGAGGLTHGFRQEAFTVAAGIDIDEACRYAYEHNNDAPFVRKDVGALDAAYLRTLFRANEPSILVGCAPCQPFSKYNQKNADPKWRLVYDFTRLILQVRPDIVSMENVPRLLDFQGGRVFDDFVSRLEDGGYNVSHSVVFAPDYGLAQKRSRLVLLASLHGKISLEAATHSPLSYLTVNDAIGNLPPIDAGRASLDDPLHRASGMADINLERIRASRPGGSWQEWDHNLVAACHRVQTGRGYTSVYGRMRGDEPSPTITTQFFGFGNGRFGHPEQDRALSLREGAILQSFPRSYAFVRPGEKIEFKKLGRMIGNAVPVILARSIARSIKMHIEDWP